MRTISLGAVLALTLLLASCGGGSSSTTTQKTTVSGDKFPNRVYISNAFFGQVNVLDSATDSGTAFRVTGFNAPKKMLLSTGKFVMVYDANGRSLNVIDLATESVSGAFNLTDNIDNFVLSPDGKFAYAALRNQSLVAFVDIVNQKVTAVPPQPATIPQAHRLLLSKDGTKLLVFGDNSDSISVIDTSTKNITTVPGFDRPYTGTLSSDNNKVYILSCGPECGGTVAKVSLFDMTTNTITIEHAVSGATVAALDSTSLYVAGNATGTGTLDVLDAATLVPSKTIPIRPGLHTLMAVPKSGKVYVGASACSASPDGCLSIVAVSSGTVVTGEDTTDPLYASRVVGDVTSILPITGRNVVYVIRGGNLRIVDGATDKPQTKQFEITGAVFDVIEVK